MNTVFRLLRLIAPFRWWVALAVLLAFATVGANVGLMAMSAYLISRAALVSLVAELSLAIAAVRLFAIGRVALRYLERYLTHRVTFRVLTHLRVWFYESIEPLAPARLQAYRSGDLLARIMADIETLENFYIRVIVPPLAAAFVTALTVGILGAFDIWIGLALFFFLLLTGVALPTTTHYLGRQPAMAQVDIRAELSITLVDEFQGLADILTNGQAARYQAQMQRETKRLQREQERVALLRGVSNGLAALFTGLAALTVLWIGIPLVVGGAFDGVFLALLPLTAIASFEAVQPLAVALQYLDASKQAGDRLFELIDAPPAVREPTGPLAAPNAYDIDVRNLRFRYGPHEPWVFDGLSLSIPAGGRLALIGPSGAGKSTLVRLLLRYWDYDEGEIRLGGRDLRHYRSEDVRRAIGVVSQRTHLFNTTIRDNLLLADPAASEEAIVAACRQAQLHDFITTLPLGYDTLVGENGVLLSGGERQRLALARAILKDAPILILDEGTAYLDAVTEEKVMAALDDFMVGRTTLFIAHQSTGLRHFPEVVTLTDGRVGRQASRERNPTTRLRRLP